MTDDIRKQEKGEWRANLSSENVVKGMGATSIDTEEGIGVTNQRRLNASSFSTPHDQELGKLRATRPIRAPHIKSNLVRIDVIEKKGSPNENKKNELTKQNRRRCTSVYHGMNTDRGPPSPLRRRDDNCPQKAFLAK
ncbi:hypothetical protein STAS_19239 [Striga asiatica]|uniref:Uncharacterized protein n=1 Tax=Striga asiatica TaxID=4170 RepID=A0A5A7QBL8_STRAF|nr:hypothetical protein STAS_19239 [Striga asiatica]